MVHPIILETRRYYTERMSFMANMPYSFAQLGDTDVLARRHAAKLVFDQLPQDAIASRLQLLYTSLTGHLTPRIEEHLARVYRPVPITNAGCETALKPLSSSRVDRMGAAQVAAHVKAHTEPLHTWYQYITEDSLAANRAAKRQRVADAKAPSCVLVATPINTTASPLLSAATIDPSPNPAPTLVPIPTATPSYATRAGAATVTRKLQEQQRREKRAAAELSITMKLASAEARQQFRATAAEQQAAAKEQANTRARKATQQLQVIAMYSSMIQPLPQNTLKLSLHQLRQLWGVKYLKFPQDVSQLTAVSASHRLQRPVFGDAKRKQAGYLHCPSGLKAIARRAEAIAQQVRAENEVLMTEAQLQQACEEVLEAALLDLEEKHKHLQASHRQERLDNESLEAVVKQQELAMTTAKRAQHRLEAQLRKYQRRPQLTRKQRQQLQILKQTGVSIEVLRRWADSNCSRLDTHGRPGGTTVQPTPGPSPPEPTPGPSPPEPCDPFIPTQEASPGQSAARTTAYTARQYLSTARLMLKTQVSRRRLSTRRRLFITEQCVVASTHRPGERTTVGRQLRVVYKYLRQRTLDELRQAKAIHVQFDGCTCKKHGKVLVIRVTAAVGAGSVPDSVAAGQHQRLTAQITDVLAIVPLPCATAEAHVQVIMRELERNGLLGVHIASMTADSASVNMGGHNGVIAQLSDVLMSLQNTAIRAQPCYSHGLHNTLLAGLTALGIKAAIEDIASLLAQHWGELSLAGSGAKPETPCDTRWASYTTAAASVIRVWRLAGEAVARVVEGQRERSPPWAVTLSGYFKDTDLLLKICVVAVVGSSLLQPELLWAIQHDGLHAFELYRHVQAVQTSLSQTWTNSSQLLSDMQGQLQHLVPAPQRQQQEHQLLTYLQVHCRAMSSYYEQHVRVQNALPGLFAALGSSDTTTRWEAAQEVVSHAERMQQQQEDQEHQQEVEGQQQKRTGQRLPMCDPRVWDAHGTWEKHEEQIRDMADMRALSEQDQQQLQAHLEVYYLACPISNAPVESLLQLLKHGTGMFMELPALLELMSMRTHIDAIDGVDVLDFAQRLPELRKEVRREEAAAAMARRIAKAEMKAAAAIHRVGQVVVDVGDHEGQHRLSAAYALTYDGRDYSHTTVEEAEKLSVRELQAYLRFHQQELMVTPAIGCTPDNYPTDL
ncbi:hypothetical protein QJQ45_010242 [Haematococcus lacustris]|nr:hypothetical protein QJQ45_010242 [Haematococcus lacustris]